MKLRYYCILICIILIGGYAYSIKYINEEKNLTINMVEVNDKLKEVEEEIKERGEDLEAINVEDLEHKYKCEILFLSNEKYEEELSEALKNNKLIIDLIINEDYIGKLIFDGQSAKLNKIYKNIEYMLAITYIIILIIAIGVIFLIFINYIYPFNRLQKFALHISKGDLDIPLPMTKNNYFGAFTESFDIMREELKKARHGEYMANVSKKELIASLSHDIKTPVATIKAICEILLIQVKEQKVKDKLVVIDQKANIIDSLITDMFHSTLDDLLMLKTNASEELSTVLMPMFEEINHYGLIKFKNSIPECLVYIDKLRINQVIDNIINNSYKYANTNIYVSFYDNLTFTDGEGKNINAIKIRIKDEGKNISEEDLPYLIEKFYRGENSKGKEGSGLGLYLANQFMEQMEGSLCYFIEDGFVVELLIRKV